jgi:cyclophilin family peptidyl-prolyl cis-trans isomerase
MKLMIFAALMAAFCVNLVYAGSAHAQTHQPPSTAEVFKLHGSHPIAIVETSKGVIKFRMYPDEAPVTVANFVKLAQSGFYSNLIFHRVEPGFVIQGGDPQGDGSGGPGYSIQDEQNKLLRHNRGAVAMAKSSAPNSAGSQWYICINQPAPHLDGGYTVFGQVISGQLVAEKIAVGDKIKKVTIKYSR